MTDAQKRMIRSVEKLRTACDVTLTKLRREQSPELIATAARALLHSGAFAWPIQVQSPSLGRRA